MIHHLSDLHIGASASEAAQLKRIVSALVLRAASGERAVITGDLTETSAPEEWARLKTILAPLCEVMPVHMVLGNHDCGNHGITYDAQRAARADAALAKIGTQPDRTARRVTTWGCGPYKIIGLDSSYGNEDDWLPPLARGEIGAEQFAALEVEVAEVVPTVVILHHHPRWKDPAHLLEDRGALTQIIARRPQVVGVLFGHQHEEWREGISRVWMASGKSTEPVDGRLRWRTFDPLTRSVGRLSCPAA